jgi:hypothetical protein
MNNLQKHLVTIDNGNTGGVDSRPQPNIPTIQTLMQRMQDPKFRERVELMVRADDELRESGAMIQHIYSNRDNETSLKDEYAKKCLEMRTPDISIKNENTTT